MEVAGKIVGAAKDNTGDDQTFCELCENDKTSADGACQECEEYMCDTCFRHHLKAKSCRNHVLVKLGELSSTTLRSKEGDVEKCKKHDNETIKFYCRAHDIVGCGDCIIPEHAACKPECIKDLVKTCKTEEKFKELFAKVDQMDSMRMEVKKRLKKNKTQIDLMKENALKEIRKFRSEINNYFDMAEAGVKVAVEKITSENTEQHKKLEEDIRSLIRDIEDIKLKLGSKENPNKEKAYFIQAVTCKPEIDTIEKRYSCIQNETSLKSFEFVRSDILKSPSQFGKLETQNTGTGQAWSQPYPKQSYTMPRMPPPDYGLYNQNFLYGTGKYQLPTGTGQAWSQPFPKQSYTTNRMPPSGYGLYNQNYPYGTGNYQLPTGLSGMPEDK